MNRVSISKVLIRRTLLLWLILMWPLLIFRGPAYFEDTVSYFKGGAVAVGFVTDRLMPDAQSPPERQQAPGATPTASDAGTHKEAELVRDAKGVRSIPYSVFSYLLAGPNNRFVPLAIVQALLLALCLTATLAAARLNGSRRFWSAAAPLAIATPAAPFASFIMPDIFAGLTILLLALLISQPRRFDLPLLLLLIVIAIFAITAHPSHFPLAGAMVLMAGAVTIGKAIRGDGAAYGMLWRTAAVLAAAVAVVVTTGVIGFGDASIAPKRYPFLLARAVEMTPGRSYLQTACKTGHFEVCNIFPDGMPTTSHEFLWGEQGVDNVATPAQMQALRDEEPKLVLAMIRTSPLAMAAAAADGVLRQLATFDLAGLNYRYDVRTISPIEIALVYARPPITFPIRVSQWLTIGSVLLSLAGFALWLRPRNPNFILAALLIGGVVANAAVCSMLSTVAPRYQARIVWILPLAALLLWNGRRKAAPDR